MYLVKKCVSPARKEKLVRTLRNMTIQLPVSYMKRRNKMSEEKTENKNQEQGLVNLVRFAFMDGYRTGLGVAKEGIKQRFDELSSDKTLETIVNNYLDYWLKSMKGETEEKSKETKND